MIFSDFFFRPIPKGDETGILLSAGIFLIALLAVWVTVTLSVHFRKEEKREQKRREKQASRNDS